MTNEADDILDRCIEEARSGRNPEDILREHPEQGDRLRPLLALAAELEALPSPTPSVRAMMTALTRAMAEAPRPAASRKKRRFFLLRLPGPARAAVAVLAFVLVAWGTVRASSNAVPGDLLYHVKMLVEGVRYHLTVGPEDEAELLITFSGKRLRELITKHRRGRGLDRRLIERMLDRAREALEKAPELPDVSRSVLIERVASLSRYHHEALDELKKRASPEEREALEPLVELCAERCACLCDIKGGKCTCVPARPSREEAKELLARFPSRPIQSKSEKGRQ